MADYRETAVSYLTVDDYAVVSSSEYAFAGRMLKLAQKYPDDVKILHTPDENMGMLVAHVPKRWLKVAPPPRRQPLSDEQREALVQRMAEAREKRNQTQENPTD